MPDETQMTPCFFSHNYYLQIHTAIISASLNYSAATWIYADIRSQNLHIL